MAPSNGQSMRKGSSIRVCAAFSRSVIDCLGESGFKVFSAHATENFGDSSSHWTPEAIADRDFAWMQDADIYVAIIPKDQFGRLYRSEGTMIEIGWASALKTPVLLATHRDMLDKRGSQLLRGLAAISRFSVLDLDDRSSALESIRQMATEIAIKRRNDTGPAIEAPIFTPSAEWLHAEGNDGSEAYRRR